MRGEFGDEAHHAVSAGAAVAAGDGDLRGVAAATDLPGAGCDAVFADGDGFMGTETGNKHLKNQTIEKKRGPRQGHGEKGKSRHGAMRVGRHAKIGLNCGAPLPGARELVRLG